MPALPALPYRPYRDLLASRFGNQRIRKVTVNGGFTCPNLDGSRGKGGCTYCDNRSFSPAAPWRTKPLREQIDAGLAAQKKLGRVDGIIVYFQAFSNTYATPEHLAALYAEALAHPQAVGLAIGTRPDCLSPTIIELIADFARHTYVSLELGMQSAFDATLIRIHRGHSVAEFDAAMQLCHGHGFELNVHVILGLPGEGPEHWRATAIHLAAHPFDSLKIHPLHIVQGTAIARQYAEGRFALPERKTYVEGVVDFLERMPPHIALQRFTGDAPVDMLVAPTWCRDKHGLLRDILAEFALRGRRQGDCYPSRAGDSRSCGESSCGDAYSETAPSLLSDACSRNLR